MFNLGLNNDDRAAYEAALVSSHPVRITVRILDQDEEPLGSLTAPQSWVRAGDVQIDNTAETKRSLSLEIMDPMKKLDIAPSSPAEGAVFADNFVAVEYGVWVQELEQWVDCPVFWGPVSILSRESDNAVNIEAVSKEYLLKKPHLMWTTKKFGKGKLKVGVIRSVLELKGEARFDLPADVSRKLNKPLTVSRDQEPWKVVKKLAQSMNLQIFYDGAGRLRLRRFPTNPVFVFDANDSAIITNPSISYDISKVRNTVEVIGHKNERKRAVRATAYAPKSHPLSPWALARNEKPRYMVEKVKNDHIKRLKQAKALAVRKLRKLLRSQVEVEFECPVIPHLEENDIVALKSDSYRVDFDFTKGTIPLTLDDTMSVGYNKPSKKIDKKGIIVKPRHMKHHGGGNH